MQNEEQCCPLRVCGTLVNGRNAIRKMYVGRKMKFSCWQRDCLGLRACRVLSASGLTAVLDYHQSVINVSSKSQLGVVYWLLLVQALS